MDLGITYDQLTPVMGGGNSSTRVGIVAYDGNNPQHEAVLRKALPHFLGSEGAVHGIEYPKEHLDAVIASANAGDVIIKFPIVALELCRPVVAGILTEVPTYGVECDDNGDLHIVPYLHAEDTSLDLDIAQQFREYTCCLLHPNGMGLGTYLVKQRLFDLAQNDPSWVYGGRENEYAGDNPPIIGLMNKFSATLGNKRNSPVLQMDGLLGHLRRNRWIDVKTEALPADASGLWLSGNNLATPWASRDGKQQIVMIDTLKYSTFTGKPTVWTKIKSNGNLPNDAELQEILAEMLQASRDKMDDLKWSVPRELRTSINCPIIPAGFVPERLIHLNMEPAIAEALQKIQAKPRIFGCEPMLSGVTSLKSMRNQQEVFGQPLPEATKVNTVDPVCEAQKPIFDFMRKPSEFIGQQFSPTRPFGDGHYENDNAARQALRAA